MAGFLMFMMLAGIAGAGVAWFVGVHRWHQRLARFAERNQLSYQPGTQRLQPKVRGGADVRVEVYTTREELGVVQTVIQASGRLPPDLSVHARSRFGDPPFRSGDSDFDAAVTVSGEAPLSRALLDQQTRVALREAVAQKIEVADGRVTWKQVGRPDAITLDARLDQVMAVARQLSRAVGDPELAAIVRSDIESVAVEALDAMADGPTRDEVIDEVLATRRDSVGVWAAHLRGPTAAPALAAMVLARPLGESFRAYALRFLGDWPIAVPTAEQILDAQHPAPEVMLVALEILETYDCVPSVERLESLSKLSVRLASRVARVAATHGVAAEALLIGLLSFPDDQIRLVAVQSLARVGTPAAVPHLKRALDRRNQYVYMAIRAIQSRAGHESGGLALAAGSDGALTLED